MSSPLAHGPGWEGGGGDTSHDASLTVVATRVEHIVTRLYNETLSRARKPQTLQLAICGCSMSLYSCGKTRATNLYHIFFIVAPVIRMP